jgi:peptidoglycan/xylan/chitin deacetylase (PgdA/CDA1 family)
VLSGLYHSRVHRLLAASTRGVGAIFTLHHALPETPDGEFSPNRILEITPDFLNSTIHLTKRLGYEIVSLDECRRRLVERDFGRPFVAFTFDDGYADNYTHAFPIFEEHGVPFLIYLCTGLLEGTTRQWWRDLEEIVAANDRIEVELDGHKTDLVCESSRQKRRTFDTIYWSLRRMPHDQQMQVLEDLVERYPPRASSSPRMLTREMIREMQETGLLTIGAHTLTHPALSKLPPTDLLKEMDQSRARLTDWLGAAPRHFSYPYGDETSAGPREFEAASELGFETGVTTRKGVLHPEHAQHLHALPRISLNGDYQRPRYVETLLSGVPFRLDPGLPRINVA